MKTALILLLIFSGAFQITAQKVKTKKVSSPKSDLQKLIETENSFAKTAAEKGTKTAFLDFLADDAVVFNPRETSGKEVWKARKESPALLAWNPAWADVSSDGMLGYTTGGWEFRPKGKTDQPTAFGDYVTIWQKQPDGNYKAVLDLGIGHSTSDFSNVVTKTPKDAGKGATSVEKNVNSDTLKEIFENPDLVKGYEKFLADDVIILRDKQLPVYGKKNALNALEKFKTEITPAAILEFTGITSKAFGNLLYVRGVYQLKQSDNSLKEWNYMQIWKNRGGKWLIVLDIFNPIPSPKK